MTNRFESISQVVDSLISSIPDKQAQKEATIHLYGVSELCVFLSLQRHLDPELAAIAGLLHDLYRFLKPDASFHAKLGSVYVLNMFHKEAWLSDKDAELISQAIFHHSDKEHIHNPFDELLKDADLLYAYLHSPSMTETPRLIRLKKTQMIVSKDKLD